MQKDQAFWKRMTEEARLSGRPWADNGFVNGLQSGSKVKSLSHSLRTIRAGKYAQVTKNADYRMKLGINMWTFCDSMPLFPHL